MITTRNFRPIISACLHAVKLLYQTRYFDNDAANIVNSCIVAIDYNDRAISRLIMPVRQLDQLLWNKMLSLQSKSTQSYHIFNILHFFVDSKVEQSLIWRPALHYISIAISYTVEQLGALTVKRRDAKWFSLPCSALGTSFHRLGLCWRKRIQKKQR